MKKRGSMAMHPSYNLVDEAWIPVALTNGKETMMSLREVFHRSQEIRSLSCELPTMNIVILRLLLAILERALVLRYEDYAEDDPIALWAELWNAGQLPLDLIDEYFDQWHDAFDLFAPERPFMQDPGLTATNGKVADARKLRSASENKAQLFPMVLNNAGPINAQCAPEAPLVMEFDEAARWLLHVQAFDTGGIKTGVKGDPKVKGGKRHGSSPGWLGNVGPIFVEGTTLFDTLLYNLILSDGISAVDQLFVPDDLPAWERPLEEVYASREPWGFADLYTWQSRRVRLVPNELNQVDGVVLTYGATLDYINKQDLEPMSAWHRSERFEKERNELEVYLPIRHNPEKALWRGLDALLPSIDLEAKGIRMPGVLQWLGVLTDDPEVQLPQDVVLRAHAVGFIYGTQNACINDAIDDTLGIPVALLDPQNSSLISLAQYCVEATQNAVKSYVAFARKIAQAQGASGDALKGPASQAEAEAYYVLGQKFEEWLVSLTSETDPIEARNRWFDSAWRSLRMLASHDLASLGPAALVGRMKDGVWYGAAQAERVLLASLNKYLSKATS